MSAVRSWREQGVAHIRFNRPAAFNAVDAALAQGFAAACRELVGDASIRVVVVSGEGRAFMAGGDLQALQADPVGAAQALLPAMHEALTILTELPAPVIASVQGLVAGGGLGVALAADFCIAAEGSRFHFAYPVIGASADCGSSWSLVRHVGLRRALEIALLAQPLEAAEAVRLGLVNRTVAAEHLEQETAALARQLAGGAPLALGAIKRLLRSAGDHDWAGHLQAESRAFAACAASVDFREGCAALLERRAPQFRGA